MILLSIITVVYNAENVIKQTINSVKSQKYPYYEHIIIDGGSKDLSLQIIGKMSYDKMICYSEPDRGIYDAMNKGLKKAKGDYVIFLNAGDEFASNTVTKYVVENISKHGLYYGNSLRIYEDKIVMFNEKINSLSLTRHNICHQSIFYPTDELKKIGFDEKYRIFADWATNIKLYGTLKFNYINIPICKYKMNGISSTEDRNKDIPFLTDLPFLSKNYLGFLPYLFVKIRFTLRKLLWQN